MAHENFVYIMEDGSPEEITAKQQAAYVRLTGGARPWDHIGAVYLNGTIDNIQAMVAERQRVGIEYMFLHTPTADLEQLDLIAKHIVRPFAG